MKTRLRRIYKRLYCYFGPQHWWPADTPFEIMVGAVLTQNTNWSNVEKAIANLKKENSLRPKRLAELPLKKIARMVRPSGYYNIKAGRLKEFVRFFVKFYRGSVKRMSLGDSGCLRQQLLSLNGIGPETADSILLYALGKPVFVVDAYTKRILSRHRLIKEDASYESMQRLFTANLKRNARLFNEYRALIVRLGKEFCLKAKPRCAACPLNSQF